MVIQIQIEDEIWEYLNQAKKPGEAFNDVLRRKLKLNKEVENDKLVKKNL